MHSSNFTVTTTDLKAHIQDMITLLNEPVVLRFQCAKDAIRDLRQVWMMYFYLCSGLHREAEMVFA